jgi:hypothetical protein
VANVDLIKPEF